MLDKVLSFPAASLHSRNVLVVEDQVLTRMMVAAELRRRGLKVLEAQNAHEAIAVLQSQVPVDLVFTDVRLPGSMDGLALSRLLRETLPELKIVVTSGDLPVDTDVDPADAFFPKPYDLRGIAGHIEELLGELRR